MEGRYPPGEFPVCLHRNAGLSDLFTALYEKHREASAYILDGDSQEYLVNAVIINDEFVALGKGRDRKLADGDQVFFILPIGGG